MIRLKPFRQKIAVTLAGALLCAVPLGAQVVTASNYPPSTQFQATIVLLTAHGPQASQVTLSSGPFFLVTLNRSSILGLHVSLTQNAPLASARASDVARELLGTNHTDGAQDKTTLIQLLPGSYYLTVAEQLGWTVHLTVNP